MTEPQTTKKAEGMPITYIVVGIVIVAVLAVSIFALTRPSSKTPQASNSTSVPSSTTIQLITLTSVTTAPTTTLLESLGCPCLNQRQIQIILQDSQAYKSNGTLSGAAIPNVKALENYSAISLQFTKLPQGILNNITSGWISYYTSGNGTQIENATEVVLQSTNPGSYFNYYATQLRATNQSSSIGTANGFQYYYVSSITSGMNRVVISGYANNLIIYIVLYVKGKALPPPSAIASGISTSLQ